jgi:hypothetical protein
MNRNKAAPSSSGDELMAPVAGGSLPSIPAVHSESPDCWCCPTLEYVAEDDSRVWVHHKPS